MLVSMFLNSKEKRLEMTEYFTHEILLDEVVNGYNDMVIRETGRNSVHNTNLSWARVQAWARARTRASMTTPRVERQR